MSITKKVFATGGVFVSSYLGFKFGEVLGECFAGRLLNPESGVREPLVIASKIGFLVIGFVTPIAIYQTSNTFELPKDDVALKLEPSNVRHLEDYRTKDSPPKSPPRAI